MLYEIETIKIKYNISDAAPDAQKISSSAQAAALLQEIYKGLDVDQEHLILLALNSDNKITGYKVLFSGGQNECTMDFKIIFRSALFLGAAGIIIAHNHPSGALNASNHDREFTRELKKASELMGIRYLDHIIITPYGGYYSLTDNGI